MQLLSGSPARVIVLDSENVRKEKLADHLLNVTTREWSVIRAVQTTVGLQVALKI